MQHDCKYISKRDSQAAAAYDDLMLLLQEVRKEPQGYYTFQHRVVGSYVRNTSTLTKNKVPAHGKTSLMDIINYRRRLNE